MHFSGAQEYELISPLNSGRLWSSFVASAGHESLVELRAIVSDDVPEAERRREMHRLQLLSIVDHPGLRRIIDVVAKHVPPFIVLEPPTPLAADGQHGCTIESCQRLFDALACAHRHGFFAGGISVADVRVRSSEDWLLDLTQERTKLDGEHTTETGRAGENSGAFSDPAGDVLTLSAVLNALMASAADGDVRIQTLSKQLFQSCLATDPEARPTAAMMASEFADLISSRERSHAARLSGTLLTDSSGTELVDRTLFESESQATSALMPDRLGRFTLHERLGSGAAGTVYRATDCSNHEIVALKVLNATIAGNASMLRRFTREARLLEQVGSPFVARLLDANYDQGFHFLALEFIAGGTLAKVIQRAGRLEERKALRLILDAVCALTVAHQQTIIHRDVKPENILLTTVGQRYLESQLDESISDTSLVPSQPLAKLSDFGLARADHASESMAVTHDGTILGTPLYMSPEQCRGTPADTRSDVYSVGATLFHMLAGRPPFQGDSALTLMNAHCHDPLPSLRQLCPDLSDAGIAVVETCLAKNPDARYADAAALLADLERLLHGEPTSMMLHPLTPASQGLEVLEFSFSCDLTSSPGQLWPFISNTDRINHALGLPAVKYTTRTDPVRGVERFAESKIAGQKIVWQEHPYEWIEGRRLSVLREFSTGPFLWFMNIIEMQSNSGGGTHVKQTLKVVPRNWFGGFLARMTVGRKTPKSFIRVYRQIDEWLILPENAKLHSDAFGTTSTMSATGRTRMLERLRPLNQRRIDPAVAETIRQFLEHASDPEVARIRPLVFADRFRLPAKDVTDAFLLAAKEGVLTLLWDILCPSCRIPADVHETLATLKDHGYCPSCDLRYEIDFSNSVELIFRPHPEIRAAETRTYCIGGPAFSAHVVAQIRLMPGERFAMDLMLTEGSYRLRGPQLPFAVDVRVGATGVSRFELPLLRPPLPNSVPVLRQGSQVLTLFNNTTRELQIRLERTADRAMALTAAAAASIPAFREMFPNEVLAPGQMVSVTNITLLMTDICGANELYESLGDGPAFGRIRERLMQIEEIIKSHRGAVVKIVGDGILASIQDSESAIGATIALLTSGNNSLPVRIAVHRSSALVTTMNERLDYFGECMYLLRTMLQLADTNEAILTASVLPSAEPDKMFEVKGLHLVPLERILANSAIVAYRCR